MISPLSPADDFARHVSPAELRALADDLAATRELTVCSVVPDSLPALRADLGDPRVEVLLRELTTFVRRNLRGIDAIAFADDELLLLIVAPTMLASAVTERILAAVRGHVFSGGATDRSLRLTVSMGVAPRAEAHEGADTLVALARAARQRIGADGQAMARGRGEDALDLGRFVGRAEQLARFADYLDDTVRGVGRVVAVIGESGIGASALVKTLQPEVRLRGGSLVVGSCHRHVLTAPYALWSEVLRNIRRLPVKSTRAWRELSALDPALESAGQEAGGGSKTRLLEELADFLRLAAQQRPLVLLLEDLQWADAASWDALEYLMSQLESERILIALTFTTDTSNDDTLERWRALAGRPRHHEVSLTRLTREDAKRWLAGTLRAAEPARELVAYSYRHSEGNPLLLTQLIRDLAEGGNITPGSEGWGPRPGAVLPLQADLDTVVGRRLARLTPAARALLELSAVVGRGMAEQLSIEMAGLDPRVGQVAMRHLVDAGLLVSSYDRDRPTYAIVHEEVARVVRDRLTADHCTALHLRVARALAASSPRSSAEVAGHFERAGESAEAFRFALAGADEALAVHETAAVAELLAAAARTAPSDAELAEVRVRMASTAEVAERYEEAETLADLALEWYVAQGDRVKAVEIKRTRAVVRIKRGKGAAEMLADLLALEQEAVQAGAEAERGAILLIQGQMHLRLGDLRSAQRVAEEAVQIAERVDDPALLSDACNRLGTTMQMSNPERARELYGKSLEIATTLGDPFRRMRGLNNIGVLELHSSNWDESRRWLTMTVEEARTAGLVQTWGRAELNLGVLAARIGDYDGADRALSEALRLTSMVQSSDDQLYATYNMAHVARERGRYREASDLYNLVGELAQRIGQMEVQAGAQAGMGLCRFLMGDVEGARRALDATTPLMEPVADWFQGREMEAALRLHLILLAGRTDEAAALFEQTLAMAAPTDVYGAAWITAEFAGDLHERLPEVVEAAVRRYRGLPEVVDNPRIRERFAVLKFDSEVTIDRTA